MSNQSDDLRAIVEEIQEWARRYWGAGKYGHTKVQGWIDRLSRIADKGECDPKRGEYGPETTCDGCGETIPKHHKRYCRGCASTDTRPAPPAEVWVGVHAEHLYDNIPLTGFADEQDAAQWKEQSPYRIIERMSVHSATQGKGETCGVCGETAPGKWVCWPCVEEWDDPDPDCAECEKPEQWEKLHRRERIWRKNAELAGMKLRMERKCYDEIRAKAARYLKACKRIFLEWEDMRERRDDWKGSAHDALAERDEARAEVENLKNKVREQRAQIATKSRLDDTALDWTMDKLQKERDAALAEVDHYRDIISRAINHVGGGSFDDLPDKVMRHANAAVSRRREVERLREGIQAAINKPKTVRGLLELQGALIKLLDGGE